MAGEEEIVVVFDDAAGGDTTVNVGEPVKTTTVKTDDPDLVNDLKSQLTSMRSQLSSASQRATQAENHANTVQQTARQQVNESRADTLESGILAEKAKADNAQQAYKAAFEAGDGDAMAKAQRDMSGAEARRINLEQAKASIDDLPTRRTVREQQQPAPVSSDPFEAWAAGRSPPTVAWARKNRDVVLDPVKMKKLTAAHYDAEADGIETDSPEYFKHIEKFVGLTKDEPGRTEPTSQRRPAATTMPADNGGTGSGGNGPRQVKLTLGEKASATDGTHVWNYDDPKGKFKKGDPIGVQEFAMRKLKMTEQGLYDKSYTVS